MIVAEVPLIGAVGVHDPDLALTGAIGKEQNRLTVRRPSGVFIPFPSIVGQLLLVTTIAVHTPDFIVASRVANKGD